jgi:hypothetical protein
MQCPEHGEAAPYWVRDDRVVYKHQAETPLPRVESDYDFWGRKKGYDMWGQKKTPRS